MILTPSVQNSDTFMFWSKNTDYSRFGVQKCLLLFLCFRKFLQIMNRIFSFHETRVCIFLKTSPGPYKDMGFDFHSKKVLKVMQFTTECPVVLYPDNCMSHRKVCERVGKPEVWWASRPMWAVASCSPIEKDGSFKDAYCLHYKGNYGCSKHL